jgi:hypothetical protein
MVFERFFLSNDANRDFLAIKRLEGGVRIHVDFLDFDLSEGSAYLGLGLLAERAALPRVENKPGCGGFCHGRLFERECEDCGLFPYYLDIIGRSFYIRFQCPSGGTGRRARFRS